MKLKERILHYPASYIVLQTLLGGRGARKSFVENFLHASDGERLLDIGCGPASMMDFLPQTIRYTGVDHNPAYIAYAKSRYGERGEFFAVDAESDLSQIIDPPFDIVLAMALLHHLSDEQAQSMLGSVHGLLKPGGVLITFDPVFVEQQNPIARWFIERDRGEHVRNEAGYRNLVGQQFSAVEGEVMKNLIRIPYNHCILRATK